MSLTVGLHLQQAPKRVKYLKSSPQEYSTYLADNNLSTKDISVLLNGKYFQIVEKTGNSNRIKAICMQCAKDTTILSAGMHSTSNLLRHLRKLHVDVLDEYESDKKSCKRSASKNVSGSSSCPAKIAKQSVKTTKNMFQTGKQKASTPISNTVLEKKILLLVANGLLPLSLVELEEFKDLLSYINPAVQIPSRRTLARSLAATTCAMKESIKIQLATVNHLCITADVWSTKHRNSMINNNFSRGSAALACRRFRETHSVDEMAELLDRIMSEHGLSYQKVVSTVIDNASNMVQYYKEFGLRILKDYTDENDDGESDDDYDGESDVEAISFPLQGKSVKFHFRCASHTLNLVATTDADRGLQTSELKKIKHSAMGKCSTFWNAAGKPKSAEKIQEITGIEFRYRSVSRWNSMYDSLSQIYAHKDEVNVALKELNLPILNDNELEFISEYLSVMKPISAALNKLQAEKECYYGCLLPTLLVTQDALTRLDSVEPNNLHLKHCMPLLKSVISGFNCRFGNFLSLTPSTEVTDAILASASHPYFKLRWISLLQESDFGDHEATVAQVKDKLKVAVKNCNSDCINNYASPDSSPEDDFFKTMDGSFSSNSNNKDDLELLSYLQDNSKEISSLDKYPTIKKIFKRYNTTLLSSAPVERLFSFAGMVHCPKRTRLSDVNFEQLVLLKANGESV